MAVRLVTLAVISVLVLGGLFLILRPDPPAATPAKHSFDLEIRGDGMSPEEVSVREGDRVTMSITSERPVEVHVHGYDLEQEVEPGEPTELSFEADLTGRFPMENHETEAELGVNIVYAMDYTRGIDILRYTGSGTDGPLTGANENGSGQG